LDRGSEVGIEILSASKFVEKTGDMQFAVGEQENGNRGRKKYQDGTAKFNILIFAEIFGGDEGI
jgi:hypothetical protein